MTQPILAIDPGKSGGFAWINSDDGLHCCSMPDTEGDVMELLRSSKCSGIQSVIIEDQCGGCFRPGARSGSKSMFTFGRNFGFILGALQAFGFRIELVKPQKWQKALSLGTKKDAGSPTAWKQKLKAEAQRRFPMCDVTLKTADALLLLDYARGNGVWKDYARQPQVQVVGV